MEYKDFLEKIGVISEDDYNTVTSFLPEFKSDNVYIDSFSDIETCNNLAGILIQAVLYEYDWVCCENVDFYNKTFEIHDVRSLSDLSDIKERFTLWTISNYDEIEEQLKIEEREEMEYSEKNRIIDELKNLDIEILREIYKTYKYDNEA